MDSAYNRFTNQLLVSVSGTSYEYIHIVDL